MSPAACGSRGEQPCARTMLPSSCGREGARGGGCSPNNSARPRSNPVARRDTATTERAREDEDKDEETKTRAGARSANPRARTSVRTTGEEEARTRLQPKEARAVAVARVATRVATRVAAAAEPVVAEEARRDELARLEPRAVREDLGVVRFRGAGIAKAVVSRQVDGDARARTGRALDARSQRSVIKVCTNEREGRARERREPNRLPTGDARARCVFTHDQPPADFWGGMSCESSSRLCARVAGFKACWCLANQPLGFGVAGFKACWCLADHPLGFGVAGFKACWCLADHPLGFGVSDGPINQSP